jgi:Fe-S cluster assembly ATP-binding protein
MLDITNLHSAIGNRPILKGIDLHIGAGEVHAIMGPNGSGKSTLAQVLAGREDHEVVQGTVRYLGQDLLAMKPEERALAGLFLAFQYPVEIPGVPNLQFLKSALNARLRHENKDEVDTLDFLNMAREMLALLKLDESLLHRAVNEGFSGGEKKRNEMLQMLMLEPRLAILDETDSGLDIDALKIVADGVNQMRNPERAILLVTHYQRLLDYIKPDAVHVLHDGRIVRTGGPELAHELESRGYGWLDRQVDGGMQDESHD